MNTVEKHMLKKELYSDDRSELPVLSSSFKEIPLKLSVVWLSIVIEQLVMVKQSDGYSIVFLIIFIAASSLVLPMLTYLGTYKILSGKYKDIIRRKKIIDWVGLVSLMIFSSLILSLILIGLDCYLILACAIPPALFIALFFVSIFLFYKEVRLLAYVRELMIGGVFYDAKDNDFLTMHNRGEDFGVNSSNGIPMMNSSMDVLGNLRAVNDHDNEQV